MHLPLRVHNAMLALRKVVKRYEYKPKEARGPLLEIMRVTLPLLLNMSLQLLGEASNEAGQVCPCFTQQTECCSS